MQAPELAESGCGQQPLEAAQMGGDVFPDRVQLHGVRRVDTAADPDIGRPDLEVEPGAVHAAELPVREHRGDVGLERRLVLAEAGVAPRPE